MQIAVPKSLNDIPVKAYQMLLKREDVSDIDTLSILLGIDVRVIRNLKAKSVVELNDHVANLFKEDYKLQRTFEMDGKTFGFIPNLDEATWGEINDIEQTIGKFEDMHKALSVMYRPVVYQKKEKYLIEEYVPGKYEEQMKKAPLGVAMGANVFFYNLMKDLSRSTLNYMKVEAQLLKSNGLSEENGVSMDSYLLSLEEIFSTWNERVN